MPLPPRTVRLGFSGRIASILPDSLGEGGRILALGGIEQSHVDPADPTLVRHEYLRRMATVIDTHGEAGAPLSVLHLGAGALTLPRYVQATRPGSAQTAIEIERELPGFVIDHLPLPAGTDLRIVIGDARERLEAMPGERFDVIVLDVFSGRSSPAHLACEEFYAEALGHLAGDGLLLVNVGDDAGLRFFARQARELDDAAARTGLPGPWTLTDSSLLAMSREGNLVLAAGAGLLAGGTEGADARRAVWAAAGPHPAAVLDPAETADLAARILG